MRRPRAVNARLMPQAVYGEDGYGRRIVESVVGEAMSRLTGHGGAAYVGPDGNPTMQFTGYATAQAHVTRAVGHVANYNVYKDRNARTIESSIPSAGGLTDPAQRIFADRLRRRSFL